MDRAKKGEDFGALALQYSKDPGSAQQGGDLGWFGKGRMVKEFEDAALNAAPGSVVGPIETSFGWHIIKVTDRQSTELAYSQITLQVKASNATRQAIRAEAEMLRKKVEEGQNIDSVAKQMKLLAQETPFFQRTTPILGSRPITTFAFNGAKGDVLRTDMKNYGQVVVQVTDTREAGIAPLEDVKDRITLTLQNKKRLDQLKSRVDQIHSACVSAGSLAAAATLPQPSEVFAATGVRDNGTLQSFNGEYEATAAAFKQPIGQIGTPVRGDRAWFILQVTNRADANMADFKADTKKWLADQSRRTRGNGYFTWFNKVRESSDIQDLRNQRD
jgi:parvulin-like peptidyl-prolyl isomerase